MRIAIAAGVVLLIAVLAFVATQFSGDEGIEMAGNGEAVHFDDDSGGIRRRADSRIASMARESLEGAEVVDAFTGELAISRFAQVVDADGFPVEGARVAVFSTAGDGDRGRRGRGRGGFFGAPTPKPNPVSSSVSDVNGLAAIRVAAGRFRLEASAEDLFGAVELDTAAALDPTWPEGVEALIVAHSVRKVAVKVVEPSGKTVPHVQVSLARAEAEDRGDDGRGGRGRGGRGRGRGFGGGTRYAWSGEENGIAEFELTHEQEELHSAEWVQVTALLPGFDRDQRKIRLEPEGVTEFTLEIPPTVTVEIALLESKDRLFAESTQVTWIVAGQEGENPFGGRGFRGRNVFGMRTVENGRTTVAGFAPGASVTFRAAPDSHIPASTEEVLPPEPSVVTVPLMLGAQRPWLTARLVEEDGTPVARERFTVNLVVETDEAPAPEAERGDFMARMMSRMNRTKRLRSDAEGAVKIPVIPEVSGVAKIQSMQGGGGMWGQEASVLASAEFVQLDPGEERDVGELSLDRGPLLVSGKVVDGQGQPKEGVFLRLRTEKPESEQDAGNQDRRRRGGDRERQRGRGGRNGGDTGGRGRRGTDGGQDGRNRRRGQTADAGNRGERNRQGRDRGGRDRGGRDRGGRDRGGRGRGGFRFASTKADGSFKIHGEAENGTLYAVEVTSRDVVSERVPFDPGAEGVLVTVVATGGVKGKLAYTDPQIAYRPEVRFKESSLENDDWRDWRRFGVNGETGEFEAKGLKPGSYDLQVRLGGVEAARITNIQVPEGEIAEPAELAPWLVGQGFELAEVILRDDAGQPVAKARVSFASAPAADAAETGRGGGRNRGRGNWSTERTDEKGRAQRVVKIGSVTQVSVRATDFSQVRVDAPDFPLEVILERGTNLRLSFGASLPEVEGLRSYRVTLYRPGDYDLNDSRARRSFSASSASARAGAGDVTFKNLEPGEFIIALSSSRGRGRGGRGSRRGSSSLVQLGNLSIGGQGGDQEFTIAIDVEAIAQAFAPPPETPENSETPENRK